MRLTLLAAALFIACAPETPPAPATSASAPPTPTVSAPAPQAPAPPVPESPATPVPPAPEPPVPATFITPEIAQPGRTVAGLRIVSADLKPSMAAPGEWVGDVLFAGEVEVAGEYRPHFDSDNDARCFFVDPADSAKLPRVPNDVRKSWFCFTNPKDVTQKSGRAVIRIADFHYYYSHSDVVNAARFLGSAK